MTRFRVYLWVVGLSLASGLASAEAVVLEYRPSVGQTASYKVQFAGRMQRSVEGEEPFATSKRYQATVALTYTTEVVSQTDDGTVVQIRMQEGQADVTAGDVSETVNLGTLEARTPVDRRRLSTDAELSAEQDLTEVSPGVVDTLASLGLLGGEWLSLVDVIYLPEAEVEPGAVWFYEDAPGEGAPGVTIRVEFRLLQLTTRDGRKCAKISASWSAPFSESSPLPGEEGAEGTATGVLSGEYVVYYDYENCLELYVEGSVGTSITMGVSGVPVSATQKQQVNVKARLVE
jgi:hypothetical protein